MKKFAILLIKLYQGYGSLARRLVWPVGVCRFSPTCSEYVASAVEKFGVVKGSILGLQRIARCHPFSKGGFEPIP